MFGSLLDVYMFKSLLYPHLNVLKPFDNPMKSHLFLLRCLPHVKEIKPWMVS